MENQLIEIKDITIRDAQPELRSLTQNIGEINMGLDEFACTSVALDPLIVRVNRHKTELVVTETG